MNHARGIIALLSLLLLTGIAATSAQVQDARWSAPLRLSTEGSIASEAFMVTDDFGFLHAFWVESGLPDGRVIIQYSRFDGENWTPPIDIYASKPGGTVGNIAPAVDAQGTLHLLWTGGVAGPLYYATAPAYDALSARHWSSPARIEVPAYRPRLLIDARGILHVVYANFYGQEPGVYYMRSEDGGKTWNTPIRLDPDIPAGMAPLEVKFALDDRGGLHAMWNYVSLAEAAGKAIRYAHSLDGGFNWSLPMSIDEADEAPNELRAAKPGMVVQGQNVYAIWAGTADTNREFRFSTDAGQTWSVPLRIFGGLHGEAIGDGLALDAAGRLHFVGQIRWPQGLYHAIWDGVQWTQPALFYLIASGDKDPIGERIHAHHVRLAVRAGNQLVVTFTNSPGDATPLTLYAMHRTLEDVPPLEPLPTPPVAASPTPVPSP
ncbi:MAG: exo-alpha-sialidase, partial [Caldilineae bacterium]